MYKSAVNSAQYKNIENVKNRFASRFLLECLIDEQLY